jgi:Zn-dependent metalloprotease
MEEGFLMKRSCCSIVAVLVLSPVLALAQYYPGKITNYRIGRPPDGTVMAKRTAAQLKAAELIQAESEVPVGITYDEKSGVPSIVTGKFALSKKSAMGGAGEEAAVKEFLNRHQDLFRLRDADQELQLRRSEMDNHGLRTLRLAQTHEGVPVYGGELIAHLDREGALTSVNGSYLPGIALDTAPRVSAEEAIALAKGALGIADDNLLNTIGPELMIYPWDGTYYLAWCLTLVAKKPFAEWKCFVDAAEGKLIKSWNDTKYQTAATLTGTGVLGEALAINGCKDGYRYCYWVDGCIYDYGLYGWIIGYAPIDLSKQMYAGGYNGIIETRDMRLLDPTVWYDFVYMCNSSGTNYNAVLCGFEAVSDFSGHYHSGQVYDHWLNTLGRNSINNNGMDIIVNVNGVIGGDPTNAMWSTGVPGLENGAVFFGCGDGSMALSQSGSLSCVTHELTHGVTQYTCNLEYQYQSGAINEAFSDSFAYALESTLGYPDANEYNGEGTWIAYPGYLRNLMDPHLGYPMDQFPFGSLPRDMSEYVTTEQDNGGVHINMSIISHCFWLLCQSIGVPKGEQIWYRTQTAYCTTTTNFNQLRDNALAACRDIYGEGDEYYAVMNAFAAVGIGSGVTIVSPGEWLTVTVTVPPNTGAAFGYNGYSIVTTPQNAVYTVWGSRAGPFRGPVAWTPGLPYGYSGYVFNGPVPAVSSGNYLFETALIPARIPQSRDTAVYYGSYMVRVR